MFSTNSTPFTMPVAPCSNGGFGGFGDNGAWWLIILIVLFGWGGNGWNRGGFGGTETTSVYEGYVLNNDFSQLSKQISDTYNMTDRKFEGISNGICSLGYDQLGQMNGINTNILTTGNSLQAAIKDCCCQTQQNLKDVSYNIGSTGAAIQNQMQTCCCDIGRQIERGFADTNYAMATQNCATLQAIDKVGDRILERMTQDKIDVLTSENQSLRLAASQSAQNQYLISALKPLPIPSYQVANPWGCNCQCNQGYYGTTIA